MKNMLKANVVMLSVGEQQYPQDYLAECTESTRKNTDYLDTDSKKDRRMREMFMLNIYWFMQTLLENRDIKVNMVKKGSGLSEPLFMHKNDGIVI